MGRNRRNGGNRYVTAPPIIPQTPASHNPAAAASPPAGRYSVQALYTATPRTTSGGTYANVKEQYPTAKFSKTDCGRHHRPAMGVRHVGV